MPAGNLKNVRARGETKRKRKTVDKPVRENENEIFKLAKAHAQRKSCLNSHSSPPRGKNYSVQKLLQTR
jgi:hypothetical protein